MKSVRASSVVEDVTMVEDWYVQEADGSVSGPLAERDVAERLMSGKIGTGQFVRQGKDAEWCDAERAKFVFQRLAETGWYVQHDERVFGPFTETKLLDLYRSNEIAESALLRQGREGSWKPVATILSQWQPQQVSPARANDGDTLPPSTKWSVAPLRHVLMQMEATSPMRCQRHERLLFRDDDHQIVVERTCGEVVGRLSADDARQVRFNSERGITHLAFYLDGPDSSRIAVLLCPPGADAAMCHRYLNDHFRADEILVRTEDHDRRDHDLV